MAEGTRMPQWEDLEVQRAAGVRWRQPTVVAPSAAPSPRVAAAGPANLLALQRSVGNAAVVGLLAQAGGQPQSVQRLSFGSVGKRLKTAGRAALFLGKVPVHEVQGLVTRLKRHWITKKDVAQIQAMASEMGLEEELRKKGWEQDKELLHAISEKTTEEAIERGLTVNF